MTVVDGPGRGIAAAINAGIRGSAPPDHLPGRSGRHPRSRLARRVCSRRSRIPSVAAAQGHYRTAPDAGFWARMMGRDLEQRYRRIRGARRRSRLHRQHRLSRQRAAPGRPARRDARLRQRQRPQLPAATRPATGWCSAATPSACTAGARTAVGYLRQQYGVGYGRLDLLSRGIPRRAAGDDVSGALMMAHAPLMLVALAGAAYAAARGGRSRRSRGHRPRLSARRSSAGPVRGAHVAGVARGAAPAIDAALGVRRSRTCCAMSPGRRPSCLDRAAGAAARSASPARACPRAGHRDGRAAHRALPPSQRMLALVPAFNEAPTLPAWSASCRGASRRTSTSWSSTTARPTAPRVCCRRSASTGSRCRSASASAARCAPACATRARAGYDYVVRIDGDGQHRACDIARMLAPVVRAGSTRHRIALPRAAHAAGGERLRACQPGGAGRVPDGLDGERFTDPTSGFWLFGPRAVRLLGRIIRPATPNRSWCCSCAATGCASAEVPIRMRPRLAGRTSLTRPRAACAFARTILALLMVPVRGSRGRSGA